MDKLMLNIISFMHLLLILFVIGVPILSNDLMLIILHAWIIPFILLHWYLNDNKCMLVVIEKRIREKIYGKNHDIYDKDCISCKLIEPVYDFNKTMEKLKLGNILCIITLTMWLISVSKIQHKYSSGEISQTIEIIKKLSIKMQQKY
jgi:hypothetical protein